MATQDTDYVYDYGLNFLGGQDASKAPDRIAENAYHAGVNVTTDRGVIGPRSAFVQRALDFSGTGNFTLATLQKRPYEAIFSSGKFQALIPYALGGDFYQIIIIAGIIFLVNQNTYEVSVIEIEDGSRIDESAARVNWSAAGAFLTIFDYPARPVIITGTTARRSDPDELEVPVSRLGTYNQNRLFIGNAGIDFTAGDPAGDPATPNAPVTFEEVLLVGSPYFGQIFQLPTGDTTTPISAMTFLQVNDTSTGIGPLLVATQKSIFSFNTQVPRNLWVNGQFGTILVHDAGIAGPRAFCNVNSDLFFISLDGQLRSASMSRDEQKRWSRVPLSAEVQNWIKFFDPTLVQYAAVGYFNNRIYATVNPYRTPARNTSGGKTVDFAHGGMVTINTANISGLNSQGTAPVWDGLWTGVRPMDFSLNDNRFFIMSKDAAFVNRLYEVDPKSHVDRAGTKRRRPVGHLYTRQMDCKSPFQNKETQSLDVSLANMGGEIEMEVRFKPAQSPRYLPWRKFKHTAPISTCKIPSDKEVNGFQTQELRELNLGMPEGSDECDPLLMEEYRLFRELQLKFTIRGEVWELSKFRLSAVQRPQSENQVFCTELPVIAFPAECDSDWAYEEIV